MRLPSLVLALTLPCAAWCETHVVTIGGMKMDPAVVTVKPGDKVEWRNKDLVPHTATAPRVFDSGQIDPGKSWTWTAKTRGRHGYVCTYHPGMQGTVIVQ